MLLITSTWKVAERAIGNVRTRALLAGAALGSVAWGLSNVAEHHDYNLAMALIVIGSGAVSFVLHGWHEQAAASGAGRRQTLAAETRLWLCGLGSGICLAMLALQWLAG